MKATLEFSLPEEAQEHRLALDGNSWHGVVWELDQWLRGIYKHGSNEVTASAVRDKIRELMEDARVNFPE